MTFQGSASKRGLSFGIALQLCIISVFATGSAANAIEKLVDPNTVAPEYRAAAEKRRAEQIKLFECTKKADEAKVQRRDRVGFINECVDK